MKVRGCVHLFCLYFYNFMIGVLRMYFCVRFLRYCFEIIGIPVDQNNLWQRFHPVIHKYINALHHVRCIIARHCVIGWSSLPSYSENV
jgi:hypothetical protein